MCSCMPTVELCLNAGFDLVDVGRDEVTIKAGKQANKRTLTFALQALAAIFGEYNTAGGCER